MEKNHTVKNIPHIDELSPNSSMKCSNVCDCHKILPPESRFQGIISDSSQRVFLKSPCKSMFQSLKGHFIFAWMRWWQLLHAAIGASKAFNNLAKVVFNFFFTFSNLSSAQRRHVVCHPPCIQWWQVFHKGTYLQSFKLYWKSVGMLPWFQAKLLNSCTRKCLPQKVWALCLSLKNACTYLGCWAVFGT